MKKMTLLFIALLLLLTSCKISSKSELNQEYINYFEERYKKVEFEKQLRQLCNGADNYSFSINSNKYYIVFKIDTNELTGTMEYFEQYSDSNREKYNIKLTDNEIVLDNGEELPIDTLLIFRDLKKNAIYYDAREYNPGGYHSKIVQFSYDVIPYFYELKDNLIDSIGSETMNEDFQKQLLENKKMDHVIYEYDFTGAVYKTESWTRIGPDSFRIEETCK